MIQRRAAPMERKTGAALLRRTARSVNATLGLSDYKFRINS